MDWKENTGGNSANRNYKDTVFRMLFKDKERLLELYNAVSGRSYTDSGKLEIVMLESAVYMGMRNDLAFLIDLNLYLFEHQSTLNPNMPLRFLQYVSAEYEKLIVNEDLHKEKLVKIPAPHFVVFYNGTEPCGEKMELRLSDAFYVKEEKPKLELWVQLLNINSGFNESLKEQCRTLKEYMEYVDMLRSYLKEMPLADAVDRAVDECIRQGILREFLQQNKAEVKKMSVFEYDENVVKNNIWKDAFEDGKLYNQMDNILDLLEEVGLVSEELRDRIERQEKLEVLKEWHKLAARVKSVSEFEEAIGAEDPIEPHQPEWYRKMIRSRLESDAWLVAYTPRKRPWDEREEEKKVARAEGIIDASLEDGLSKQKILERLQEKLNIPLEIALEYYYELRPARK